MTNEEYIKQLSTAQLAKLITKYCNIESAPWELWFSKNYCDKCKTEEAYLKDLKRVAKCAWCEVRNKCRFFPMHKENVSTEETARLWLLSQYGEDDNCCVACGEIIPEGRMVCPDCEVQL